MLDLNIIMSYTDWYSKYVVWIGQYSKLINLLKTFTSVYPTAMWLRCNLFIIGAEGSYEARFDHTVFLYSPEALLLKSYNLQV